MAAVDQVAARRYQAMLAAAARWQARQGARDEAQASRAAFGGSGESALRETRFDARQAAFAEAAELRERGQLPVFIERKIGATLDFLASAPSEAARKAGHPVARIVSSVDPHIVASGYGSGFMVHQSLLLTNCHVFPDKASAIGQGANFGYEQGERGLEQGTTFAFDPDRFFIANEELDFALVAVSSMAVTGEALDPWGTIIPTGGTGKILVGQPINIVQYPDGGPKQYATRNNELIDILDDGFLHYKTDTLEGSSGSPAFSEAWELVALHHAGVPEVKNGKVMTLKGEVWTEEMGDAEINWIANEGIRISAIVQALGKVTLDDPIQAAMLRKLLSNTTDPADDILKVMASAGAAPESKSADTPISISIPSLPTENAMANGVTMNFTGPVTINIYTGSGAAADDPGSEGEVAVEKSLRFDPDYTDRKGYDPAFLGDGLIVPMPDVAPARLGEMVQDGGKVLVLPYYHYSLTMNATRRLPMWAASNADYAPERRAHGGRASFGTDKWIKDKRLPDNVQLLEADIYTPAHQIDLGHIVRRQDSAWGDTDDELEFSNSDTFHLTNCTPQHEAFNRASPSTKKYGAGWGLWGGLEMYTQSQMTAGDTRCCLLAGPVLSPDDPSYDFGHGEVLVPTDFWKVVVVADRSTTTPTLRAFGFILSQKDLIDEFGIEFAPGRFAKFIKPLSEISAKTGVLFDKMLLDADQSNGFVDVAVG